MSLVAKRWSLSLLAAASFSRPLGLALGRVDFGVLNRPCIDELFEFFLIDSSDRQVIVAVKQLTIHHGAFAFEFQHTQLAEGADDHLQSAVLIAASTGINSEVIAVAGRTPADFAEEGFLLESGEMVGDLVDRSFDTVREREPIGGVESAQFFFAELFFPLLRSFLVSTLLSSRDCGFKSRLKVVTHQLETSGEEFPPSVGGGEFASFFCSTVWLESVAGVLLAGSLGAGVDEASLLAAWASLLLGA